MRSRHLFHRTASRRAAGLGIAGLLLVGSGLGLATSAQAAPPATLTGAVGGQVAGEGSAPSTVAFTYTFVVPVAVTSTVFTTRQPAGLPAEATGVAIDDIVVPDAQVTRPDSVDIAVQAGPLATDGLTAGTHTITFTADVITDASSPLSATASASWVSGGLPANLTSAPVPVAVNAPDLTVVLTPDSGEDVAGPLGTGGDLDLAVDVSNIGYGNPRTDLFIALPAGIALGDDGVVPETDDPALTCVAETAPRGALCHLGRILHGDDPTTVDIDLTTTAAAVPGVTVPVTVAAAPVAGEGTDSDLTNNTATAQVTYTGTAKLSYTVVAAKAKVVLGGVTTVTLSVHNAGPQPAGETVALGIVVGKTFRITHFTGNTTPPAGSGDGSVDAGSGFDGGGDSSSDDGSVIGGLSNANSGVVWYVGTIPAGKTVSAVLTLKAVTLGAAKVGLVAISDATDPACPNLECALTSTSIEAVPVPVVKAPVKHLPTKAVVVTAPVLVTASDAAKPELANTGAASKPIIGLGLALLLSGAGLAFAGRRRA